MTGVKDVTLTATPKRQTFRAAVTILAERLALKQKELIDAQRVRDEAIAEHDALRAEVSALSEAYELVKPKPRTRSKKGAKS